MNPEVMREVTRRVRRIRDMSPADRPIIADHARRAASFEALPEWLRSLLRRV